MTGTIKRKGLTAISVLASTKRESSDISVTCFPAFLCAALNSLKFSTKFCKRAMHPYEISPNM